jgi:hypothetical protein
MQDFEIANEVINKAIQNSSYITVLISSGVFIIYTLIIRLVDYFKAKDRNRPLIEMAEAIKEVSENVVRLNNVLDRTFKTAELKEETNIKNIVSLACDSWTLDVVNYCNDVIIHDNIENNKTSICNNLTKYIHTEYYKLYQLLSAYEINNINISTKLKEEWIEELAKECLNVIYEGGDKINRISHVHTKVQVIITGYSVYILNKVFNH